MRKARVRRAVGFKLWWRELNRAQRGKQPNGHEVSFSRNHSFVGMSVYRGGRMIRHVCRSYPWAVHRAEALHIRDTEYGQPQREADGDVLWA